MNVVEPIGLEFSFSGDYIDHLVRLFENIQVEAYTWYVSCSQNFSSDHGNINQFLPDGIYSGKEFATTISSTAEYYMLSVRLFAVPEKYSFDSDEINDYDDYLHSNAEIALLCADTIVDFYAKNQKILQIVFESCKRHYSDGFINPQFITLQNDSRTGFWV